MCNPYCIHCAAAQSVLDDIVRKNTNVRLQIIFMVDPDTDFYKQTPIDIFLSIYHRHANIEEAISLWYSSKNKDKNSFYNMFKSISIDDQLCYKNAKKMYNYCQTIGIMGTPTIFINGHKLPESYLVNELKYVL